MAKDKNGKKKKHILRKIILTLILFPLSIVFILFCVVISTYHNFQIPDYEELQKTNNLATLFEDKLDKFLLSNGNSDIEFNFKQKEINAMLYQFFYKNFSKNEDFLKKEKKNKDYVMLVGKDAKNPDIGFKGAWIKIDGDILTICAGVDIFKPISYKTSVYLSFKIDFATDGENIKLTLTKAYIGNLVISLSLVRKIMPFLQSKIPQLKNILDTLKIGMPKKSPLLKFDIATYTATVPLKDLFRYLKEESKNKKLYKQENESDVVALYDKVSDSFAKKKLIDFQIKKSEISLSIKANRLKKDVVSFEEQTRYYQSDRLIDVLQDNKNEILLGLNNTNAKDIIEDESKIFSICFSKDKLRKLFQYIIQTQNLTKVPLFEKGVEIRLHQDVDFKYIMKATFPDVLQIENGKVELFIKIVLYKKDNPEHKLDSAIIFKTSPKLQGNDLKFSIDKIEIGKDLLFDDVLIKGLLAHIKNVPMFQDNEIIIQNFKNMMQNLSSYKVQNIIITEHAFLIIIQIEETDLKIIKDALIKTLDMLILDERYKSEKDRLLIVKNSTKEYTISQKAKAMMSIFEENKEVKKAFFEDLIYYLNASVGKEVLEVLKIRGNK